MLPGGFEPTLARYVEGLASYGWRPVKQHPSQKGFAILQKQDGLSSCRQLWLTAGGRIAPKGVDLATVPEKLNFELHSRTRCYPLEKTS
jgi:hypothetical protein